MDRLKHFVLRALAGALHPIIRGLLFLCDKATIPFEREVRFQEVKVYIDRIIEVPKTHELITVNGIAANFYEIVAGMSRHKMANSYASNNLRFDHPIVSPALVAYFASTSFVETLKISFMNNGATATDSMLNFPDSPEVLEGLNHRLAEYGKYVFKGCLVRVHNTGITITTKRR